MIARRVLAAALLPAAATGCASSSTPVHTDVRATSDPSRSLDVALPAPKTLHPVVRRTPKPVVTVRPVLTTPRPASRSQTRGAFPWSGVWPWDDLVNCESLRDRSWDPRSPSKYRGYFQFLPSTYASVGGTGDPALASPTEQWRRARILQRRDGWGPWPQCAAQLGLL